LIIRCTAIFDESDEISFNTVDINFAHFDRDQVGRLNLRRHVSYLCLKVAAVDLTEACILRLSKHESSVLSANLNLILLDLAAAVLNDRLS